MDKSKLKSKRSFRRRLPPIQSGDIIYYRNMSLISRFISEQGKILSRRVNRLTLKQQRLITIAIKQAFSLLPFLNNEKQLERSEAIARTIGLRTRNKEAYPSIESKCKSKRSRCFVQKIREPRFDFRVVRIKKKNEGRRINLFFLLSIFVHFDNLMIFIILISTLPSRSSFCRELNFHYSDGFFPLFLFSNLI